MRRRGPGIARTVARTAVVAGTATATSAAVNRHIASKQQPPQPPAAAPAESAPAAAPAPTSGMSQEQIDRLKQLAQLRDQGVLTEEEFQTEKQRMLAG